MKSFLRSTIPKLFLMLFVLPCAVAQTTGARGDSNEPPASTRGDALTELHGAKYPDPYRWLEDAQAPGVQQWIAAQNIYANDRIFAGQSFDSLLKRMRELAVSSPQRFSPQFANGTLFYLEQADSRSRPVLMSQAWPNGKAHKLFDADLIGSTSAITEFWPSPKGHLVAYTVADGHDDIATIHIFDTLADRDLTDRLHHVGGTVGFSLAWDANERGFDYVRLALPKNGQRDNFFDAAVYHHSIDTDSSLDSVSFSSNFSPLSNLSLPIAEYRLLSSASSQHTALLVRVGDGGPCVVYVRDGILWKRVLGEDAGISSANWVGERLLAISTTNTPKGSLLSVSPSGAVTKLLPEGQSAMHTVASIGANDFLLTRGWGSQVALEHYKADGKLVRNVDVPGGLRVDSTVDVADSQHALIEFVGWTVYSRWATYDSTTGALNNVFEVKSGGDSARLSVTHDESVSKDGTHIPFTTFAMQAMERRGTAPTILYADGAFGESVSPRYLGIMLAWLERGGLLVIANVRGGSEFGERWHQAGMKLHKQNGAEDLESVASKLIADRWTSPDHLGLYARNAGSLLLGIAMSQQPSQYRAAVAIGGLFDMLRNETYPNGRFFVGEFGSVSDPEQFLATSAYSPLQQLKLNIPYPATLLISDADDARIAPWQSRKFAAALQHDSNSGRPVALVTRIARTDEKLQLQNFSDQSLALLFFTQQLDTANNAVAGRFNLNK